MLLQTDLTNRCVVRTRARARAHARTCRDLSSNSITLVQPQAFAGLSELISLDLRENSRILHGSDVDRPPTLILVAGSLDGLDNLTTFHYVKFNNNNESEKASRRVAGSFCDNARAQAPPLPVAFTNFCVGYSPATSEETRFVAIAALVAALIGVLLIVQLRSKSSDTTNTDKDTFFITMFSFRIFDLFTDLGVFKYTVQKVDFQHVMGALAAPAKYMSLASTIIGFLLFIPEACVFGRKLGLNKKLGACCNFFNLYRPSRTAAAVVMGLSFLLESIPQVISSSMIIFKYNRLVYTGFGLPELSIILTGLSVVIDGTFLAKLTFGKWFLRNSGCGLRLVVIFNITGLGIFFGCYAIALTGSSGALILITVNLITAAYGLFLANLCFTCKERVGINPWCKCNQIRYQYGEADDDDCCVLIPGACDVSDLFDDDDNGSSKRPTSPNAANSKGKKKAKPEKGAPEMRVDHNDGGSYTQAEFAGLYGGLAEWNAAKPTSKRIVTTPAGPRATNGTKPSTKRPSSIKQNSASGAHKTVSVSCPLGISFVMNDRGENVITNVKPGGNAEATGQLSAGMQIVTVNRKPVRGLSKKDVASLIKSSPGSCLLGVSNNNVNQSTSQARAGRTPPAPAAATAKNRASTNRKKPRTKSGKSSNQTTQFAVGDTVTVDGYDGKGIVRFVGPHNETGKLRCGVELDNYGGKNNGTVKGHAYFSCPNGKGVFVAPSKLAAAIADIVITIEPTPMPESEPKSALHVWLDTLKPGFGDQYAAILEGLGIENPEEMDDPDVIDEDFFDELDDEGVDEDAIQAIKLAVGYESEESDIDM